MKTELNKTLKFKHGNEILEVQAFELHSALLGSTVDLYYTSSRDGKSHVGHWLLAELPNNVRANVMGRAVRTSNTSEHLDALQIDNLNRAARGKLIGE